MGAPQGLQPATPPALDPDQLGPVEIFRAGTFTDMSGGKQVISRDNLDQIAASYDPEDHPSPVVIGHPETDAPAYGWIARLWVEGDVLKATIRDAAPEFVEMVKAGRYKRVSISLFLPGSTSNPVPGDFYIRHLGFLGAQAPAVPGLKPVRFSDDPAACFAISQDFAAPLSPEQAELAELRKAALDRKVEDLITQGKVLPVFKEEVLSFAGHLGPSDTISFSDGSQRPARDWFFDYLSKQPGMVSFGALDLPPSPDFDDPRGQSVKVPDGYTTDPRSAELAARAKRISRQKGVSFADALDMILTGESEA